MPRTISITVRLIRLISPEGENSTLRCEDTAAALSIPVSFAQP
jgi:hypothetical protein